MISIGTGQSVYYAHAQLDDNGGSISGRVTDSIGNGVYLVRIQARDSAGKGVYSSTNTDEDGYYSLPRLPTCDVKVFFDADYRYLNVAAEYYNDKNTIETADLVTALSRKFNIIPNQTNYPHNWRL